MSMSDLELTVACAEAMGWKFLGLASKHCAFQVNDCAIISSNDKGGDHVYDPLHDDAQAMELVKKLRLQIWTETVYWLVADPDCKNRWRSINTNLNRAIVECVAQIKSRP